MLPIDTHILADAGAVAAEACRLIGSAAQEAIRQRKIFRVVLAGGSTPGLAYQLLATTAQEWAAWEIFWGDERCLPAADPDRNSRMAQDLWLDKLPIPVAQIYVMPAELGPEMAAEQYCQTISNHQPFDLVLLGMGADGHTASLFPHQPDQPAPVIPVHAAPKPPAERVSLNFQSLRACRRQLVLVTGAEKSAALAAWLKGEALPIARAVNSDAWLLIDAALASSAGVVAPVL